MRSLSQNKLRIWVRKCNTRIPRGRNLRSDGGLRGWTGCGSGRIYNLRSVVVETHTKNYTCSPAKGSPVRRFGLLCSVRTNKLLIRPLPFAHPSTMHNVPPKRETHIHTFILGQNRIWLSSISVNFVCVLVVESNNFGSISIVDGR